MVSLRSIDPHGVSGRKVDPLDAGRGAEPRDVLGERTSLYAFLQVFRNPIGHEFERQITTFMLVFKPDDVEPVAGGDRLRTDRAGLKRKQSLFEFGRCLTGCDLTQVAALRSRRAS
jgi:hypothetical protein